MLIKCDNKGAVDLVNGHSIGGNTKHIDVRILNLRDHKDKGLLKVERIPMESNEQTWVQRRVDRQVLTHIQRNM